MPSINMADVLKSKEKGNNGGFAHKGNVPISTHELIKPQTDTTGDRMKKIIEREVANANPVVKEEKKTSRKSRTKKTKPVESVDTGNGEGDNE